MDGVVGREVSIFYDDGARTSRKDGILTNKDEYSHTLDNKVIIPNNRIIRIEVRS